MSNYIDSGKKAVATVEADAVKAYGFWQNAAAWVAAHPKVTIALAVVAVIVAAVIL